MHDELPPFSFPKRGVSAAGHLYQCAAVEGLRSEQLVRRRAAQDGGVPVPRDVDATANREAANIVARRFPTPKFTRTYAGESQERYLISIVNPSVKENINSEYIDFEGFYDCVKRLVVDDGN